MSEDKLNLIKKYKFNENILQDLEKKLEEIRTRPEDTENISGEVRVRSESLLDKIVDACILNIELNLMNMKHQLAVHLEHELHEEIKEEQINEMENMMKGAMQTMGLDKDKFRDDLIKRGKFGDRNDRYGE